MAAFPGFLLVANQIDPTAFMVGAILGGLVAGGAIGLLPFFLAKKRQRMNLAVWSLVICTLSGAILGLLLALPVALVFTLVIVLGPAAPQTGAGFTPGFPVQPPASGTYPPPYGVNPTQPIGTANPTPPPAAPPMSTAPGGQYPPRA